MLWDISEFDRDQWDVAVQGDWSAKLRAAIKHPTLKYYEHDHYSHKQPLRRFVVLGELKKDKDYGYPMRTPLAMAEIQQFDTKNEPNAWSMPFISVDPSLQGTGVARQLFRHAVAWIKANTPNAVLHRTANSATGMHWQHVADTELFAAKLPWTQKERAPYNDNHGLVHVTDFESPTARMVDAIQRKSAQDARALLQEHPGHDWGAHNQAYVYPLGAACKHLPDVLQDLLAAGAHPAVDLGWIGRSLLHDYNGLRQWLGCFEEVDRGKAFVLAMAGRAHHLHASPVWDELSPLSKEGGIALVKESGTYIARDMLKMPPESNDERWNESQWAEFSTVLEVVRAVPAPGPNQ